MQTRLLDLVSSHPVFIKYTVQGFNLLVCTGDGNITARDPTNQKPPVYLNAPGTYGRCSIPKPRSQACEQITEHTPPITLRQVLATLLWIEDHPEDIETTPF